MEHVAHQTICMQYILELSRELNVDPRACVSSFFTKYEFFDIIVQSPIDLPFCIVKIVTV